MMRGKKRKHILPCPQSIERASMNMYLIAILLSLQGSSAYIDESVGHHFFCIETHMCERSNI